MKMNYNRILILMIIISFVVILSACQEFEEVEGIENIDLKSENIAFISSRNNKRELFMVDKDGENLKKILEIDYEVLDFAISPNLNYIIIEEAKRVRNSVEGGGLYLYDLAKGRRKLIDELGRFPSWSPDGKQIIYESLADDRMSSQLILTDSSFRSKKILLEQKRPSIAGGTLDWSPDGEEVLFLKYTNEAGYILVRYLLENDKLVEISVNNSQYIYNSRWSPLENVIVAGKYDNDLDKYALTLINPDNGEINMIITLEKGFYRGLDWSSDGRYLVFTMYDNSVTDEPTPWPWGNDIMDVYVYDIEDDEIRNVTNSEAMDYKGQWIP